MGVDVALVSVVAQFPVIASAESAYGGARACMKLRLRTGQRQAAHGQISGALASVRPFEHLQSHLLFFSR